MVLVLWLCVAEEHGGGCVVIMHEYKRSIMLKQHLYFDAKAADWVSSLYRYSLSLNSVSNVQWFTKTQSLNEQPGPSWDTSGRDVLATNWFIWCVMWQKKKCLWLFQKVTLDDGGERGWCHREQEGRFSSKAFVVLHSFFKEKWIESLREKIRPLHIWPVAGWGGCECHTVWNAARIV